MQGESHSNEEVEGVKRSLLQAEELKSQGNEHFRAQRWTDALAAYRSALALLPKRREPPPPLDGPADVDVDDETRVAEAPSSALGDELDKECARARAVLNANVGACHVKLNDHTEAVKACTQALLDDPNYIKALQRRASSNEKINSWSSLSQAEEDYTKLLALLPATDPQHADLARKSQKLAPLIQAAQKRETEEMLGKLKDMGNSILGKFGLSTDNFKFEPNGQGGYSLNMSR